MRAIFCIKSRRRDLISLNGVWSNVSAHNYACLVNVKLKSSDILKVSFFLFVLFCFVCLFVFCCCCCCFVLFLFISADSCHKNMLLESLNIIPLVCLPSRLKTLSATKPSLHTSLRKKNYVAFSRFLPTTFLCTILHVFTANRSFLKIGHVSNSKPTYWFIILFFVF